MLTREQARKIKQHKCGHSVLCIERGMCTACEREAVDTSALSKPGPGVYADCATLTVIIEAESMNKASHWASAYRIRKDLRRAAEDAWRRAGKPKFIGPVRINTKLYAANRKCDPMNLLGMARKGIDDGLVACGCLRNDSWKYIVPPSVLEWEVDAKAPRVVLRIEAVNEPF